MIKKTNVYMGTLPAVWGEKKKIKTITFSLTDECNLRCTYCYFAHKTNKNVMTFEIARKAVDDILEEPAYACYDGVVWEFIGGEPTLEMELVDKISDYILFKLYQTKHKWLYCYRFMLGTNGLLYDSKLVQDYVNKHRGNLHVAITIDGSKEKHDLSRIKKDGSGSYEDVRRVIPLWQKQFDGKSTKATFSHNDLPYLKDSIINLWNMGIDAVSANIVFEDVWQEGDEDIYKAQLYELANYIIDNDLWDKFSVRFFDPTVGAPYTDQSLGVNFCGTGKMLAINTKGEYYPCVRFMPSAVTNHEFKKIGDINCKINPDRTRAFYVLNTINQSKKECLECDIAGGCAWCSGLNFDDSSIGTLFERQTHLCDMHKANVEVNKYLWRNFELKKHVISPYRYNKLMSISSQNKYLYILCDSEFPSYCEYSKGDNVAKQLMSEDVLNSTIDFCEKHNFVPIFCGCDNLPTDYYAYRMVSYKEYCSTNFINNPNYLNQLVISVDDDLDNIVFKDIVNLIVTYRASQLKDLLSLISIWNNKWMNLNICITMTELDVEPTEYIQLYNDFLSDLFILICNSWKNKNYLTVNVITNELVANSVRSCGAGKNSFTVAPDGKIYLCAGFYYNFPDSSVGNIKDGIDNVYEKYCNMDNAPLCKNCDVKHCSRCVFKNKEGTGEYHIPTELQCVISHLEYEYSFKLSQLLNQKYLVFPNDYNMELKEFKHYDPLFSFVGENYPNHGYAEFIKRIKSDSDE